MLQAWGESREEEGIVADGWAERPARPARSSKGTSLAWLTAQGCQRNFRRVGQVPKRELAKARELSPHIGHKGINRFVGLAAWQRSGGRPSRHAWPSRTRASLRRGSPSLRPAACRGTRPAQSGRSGWKPGQERQTAAGAEQTRSDNVPTPAQEKLWQLAATCLHGVRKLKGFQARQQRQRQLVHFS